MRIATSTNLVSFNPDGTKTPMIELLPLYGREGFTLLDLNWCEMMNPVSELRTDKWKQYVSTLEAEARTWKLSFNQSHAPYARHIGDHSLDQLMLRAMEADKLLGVPLIVIHPLASENNVVNDNVEYLKPFVDKAEELDLRIALENLEGTGEIHQADQLLELVEKLRSSKVGVCLDTGHAWMSGLDPVTEIHTYGSRLWATHIADNHGEHDEHLLPFYGTIDWNSVVHALKETDYQGDLTYECMKQHAHLPPSLKGEAIRHSLAIGNYLLSLS